MNVLGLHLLLELKDCNAELLDDLNFVQTSLMQAADAVGAHVVGECFHHFAPQGVTGILSIAESHISIHTWPEYRYAAADIFTCGTSFLPRDAADILIERFQSKAPEITEVRRGLIPEAVANEIAGEIAGN